MRRYEQGLRQSLRDRVRADGRNSLSGDVYIIVDHGRNRIKPLVWGCSGYVIWYKRLEEGTFELPEFAEGGQNSEVKWDDGHHLLWQVLPGEDPIAVGEATPKA